MPLSHLGSTELTRWLADSAIATWTLDPTADLDSTPDWRSLTGRSANAAATGAWLDAVHDTDRDRVAAAWATAVAHGQNFNIDFRVRCADGIHRWTNFRATPRFAPEGHIVGWVGMTLAIAGLYRFRDRDPTDLTWADLTGSDLTGSDEADGADAPAAHALRASTLRAARAMLNWSVAAASDRSTVSVSTIRRLESDASAVQVRRRTSAQLIKIYDEAGLAFINADGAPCGVRWRRASPSSITD